MPQCLNVFILLVLIKASVCLKNCTSEQYWNKSAEECQACSHCKLPQITRIPCNLESDVVCMQLKKLNFVSTVISSKLFKTKLHCVQWCDMFRAKSINTITFSPSILNRLIINWKHVQLDPPICIRNAKCCTLNIHYKVVLADITQQFL